MEVKQSEPTRTLSFERAILVKDNHEQEDRVCSLDDGLITIAPPPQVTIRPLWTSSGTCSCGSRRSGNSIAILREILTGLHRTFATYCGGFFIQSVVGVVVEYWALHLSKIDTVDTFNGDVPIRLRAVKGGSTETWDCPSSNSLLPPAGVRRVGLLGIAWRAYCDLVRIAPMGEEVAVSPA